MAVTAPWWEKEGIDLNPYLCGSWEGFPSAHAIDGPSGAPSGPMVGWASACSSAERQRKRMGVDLIRTDSLSIRSKGNRGSDHDRRKARVEVPAGRQTESPSARPRGGRRRAIASQQHSLPSSVLFWVSMETSIGLVNETSGEREKKKKL